MRRVMISRAVSRPAATEGNWKDRKRRPSGSGSRRMVASVMMPRVPSDPMSVCIRSGPVAWLGTGSVEIRRPGGTTASTCSASCSALPYLVDTTPEPRAASEPPIVAPKKCEPG